MHFRFGQVLARTEATLSGFRASQDLPEAEAHDSRIRAVGYEGD